MHANTTIPEVLGAARAYEVTGDDRWRGIVEAYWDWAVTRRGTFCTGGQTSGEIWTPPFAFASRRGEKTQEHCTVYNMIRLADVLFRWSGEVAYLDYIERNLYNGILAQQHPETGMVAYFLPLEGGARQGLGHGRRRTSGAATARSSRRTRDTLRSSSIGEKTIPWSSRSTSRRAPTSAPMVGAGGCRGRAARQRGLRRAGLERRRVG